MLLTSEVNKDTIIKEKRDRNERLTQVMRGAPELQPDLLSKVEIMTRILLYSDEPILAKGLESVLRQVEGFDLMPTCNTLTALMEQIGQGTPDLVLMDLTPEVTFAVLSEMKHAMNNSRIVLWVNSISTELAFQAMGLGVRGILRKTLPTELQVKCLQKVQAGELWFEKALTDSFLCARRVALRPAGQPALPGTEE
jgi:DNA-binding NarL/FixJ family response regulator